MFYIQPIPALVIRSPFLFNRSRHNATHTLTYSVLVNIISHILYVPMCIIFAETQPSWHDSAAHVGDGPYYSP